MSIVKLASGWMHPELPGRVFADKKTLMVALAFHAPLPPGLIAPPAQEALKKGTYGDSPIQALVDSENYWTSVGDKAKADACRAEIEKRHGPSAGAPAAAQPPKAPSKLTTQPSKKTQGWTMFYLDGAPLIELPPEMVSNFQRDYEQAMGDEDLEASVWEEAKRAADAKKPKELEPAQAPSSHVKVAPTGGGGEDEDYEVETSYGGTAKAYTRVTMLTKTGPDGRPVIDPETKKPVKFPVSRSGIEVYSPSGDMEARYALTEKSGNKPEEMVRLVGQPETQKVPGTMGEKYESFSKIEYQKDETGAYIIDPKSIAQEQARRVQKLKDAKTPEERAAIQRQMKTPPEGKPKQRTVGELTPSELAKELKRFVSPQEVSNLLAHIGIRVTASTKVVVKVAEPTKVVVRVAGFAK